MTAPLEEILRAEIRRRGAISFHRFMEMALYHPQHGYYRRARDPFGRSGDFFTAEQVQPVFGLLMASVIGGLREELGNPEGFRVVELGAGRGEMAEALAGFGYHPVEVETGALPARFTGVVLANEFFDALPVHLAVRRGETWREMLAAAGERGFEWREGGEVPGGVADYLNRYARTAVEEGRLAEANLDALDWIGRIAAAMERGYLLVIDYGYTERELLRFPRGTLMGYKRHQACEAVLEEPGERDITAHVNFTALMEHARGCGFEVARFENLARMLLRAGEEDNFASVIGTGDENPALPRRLQLKTLLFGMGETFRTLLMRKGV